MRFLLALLLTAWPFLAGAAAAVPTDASWAILAPKAGEGAAMGRALQQAADTRGLQQGFAAGLRAGLGFDPFDAATLEAAGVALDQPLAIASRSGVELASVTLRPGEQGTAHLAAWLKPLGEVQAGKVHRGWKIQLATRGEKVVAGHATRGATAVTARLAAAGGDVAATLRAAIDASAGNRSLEAAPLFSAVRREAAAPWLLWIRREAGTTAAAVGLEGDRLRIRGRTSARNAGDWLGTGAAFPGAAGGEGLLLARIALSPAARKAGGPAAGGVRFLLGQACPACDPRALSRQANTLAPLLAGPAALALSRLELRALEQGWSPAATPFAWVAAVRDPAAAALWLEQTAKLVGAAGSVDRSVDTPIGPLSFGLRGKRLFVASDAGARDRLLAATGGAASGQGAPLSATIDPTALGRALAGLSVTDALRGGLLGSLFAVRLQLGPLLQGSGPLQVEAAPVGKGTYRFDASWDLQHGS